MPVFRFLLVSLLLLAIPVASALAGQSEQPGTDDAGASPWPDVERRVAELASGKRGVALTVLIDGKPFRRIARGPEAAAGGGRFGPDTAMPLGQMSALYLALAAQRLERAGRFDLDAPISESAPDVRIGRVPERYPAASARAIVLGRSGLGMGRLQGRYCASETCPPEGDPERWLYALTTPMELGGLQSAAAMSLLAHALERASGMSIEALVEREIAAPLGLPSPRYGTSSPARGSGRESGRLSTRDRHALGAVASLAELEALMVALLAPEHDDHWLPAEERRRYFTAQPLPAIAMPWARAAYLFRLPESPDAATLDTARAASFYPYSDVRIHVLAEHGIAVLAAADFDADGGEGLARLMDRALRAALMEVGVVVAEDSDEPVLPASIPVPEGFVDDDLAGRYATVFGLVETRPDNGSFKATAAGWNFTVSPRADGWYRVRLRVLRIPIGLSFLNRMAVRPVRHGDRRLLLMSTTGGTVLLGSVLTSVPTGEDFDDWLGEYRLTNPDPLSEQARIDRLRLARASDVPVVRVPLPGMFSPTLEIPIEPEAGPIWRVSGHAPGLGERFEFETTADGRRRLHYSGYVLERR